MNLLAPAKINLFLKIVSKRDDGFHNIFSWFQAVSLYDELTFQKTDTGIRLSILNDVDLPIDDSNLIIKAARMMFDRFHLPGGLHMELTKNIPIAAGLGGGSSDAATTIVAINRLYDLNLAKSELMDLGAEIGSDLPFFFSTGQAEVTGRGEIIREISLPLDYEIALVKPPISISTKESYQSLRLDLTTPLNLFKLRTGNNFEDFVAELHRLENDFEKRHFGAYPVLIKICAALDGYGSVLTRMSGSGPSIWSLFKRAPEGIERIPEVTGGEWDLFLVQPITLPVGLK